MSKYKIEICHMGQVVREFFTDDLTKAQKIYGKYTDRPDCSTELYIDGKRLRYIDAWEVMAVGFGFLDFRSEETRRQRGERKGTF